MAKKRENPIAYTVGGPENDSVDLKKEDVDRWINQLEAWVYETQPGETDARGKAEKIMDSGLRGRKLNGEIWPGVEHFNLTTRIKQLSGGFNIETGIGRSKQLRGKSAKITNVTKAKKKSEANETVLSEMSATEMEERRDLKIQILVQQFPWLDNPIYASKVSSLAEDEVVLEALSAGGFMTAKQKTLESMLKIKESLRKSIDETMKLLSIHPSQLTRRVDENEEGNVGNLIAKLEEMGQLFRDYENVDAIQELIQMVHQCYSLRIDGSPQLADYMLWHKTGCRGHNFLCSCGEEWELYDGFTIEELEAAALQANEVFGYGLAPRGSIDGSREAIRDPEPSVHG